MLIRENLWITKNKKGEIWSNLSGTSRAETNTTQLSICKNILSILKSRKMSHDDKMQIVNTYIRQYQDLMSDEEKVNNKEVKVQTIRTVCYELINFFKDFDFEPNFRFVNTLKKNSSSVETAQAYICNYFKLTDNQYKEDVQEKVKSQEFKNIINEMQSISTNSTINSRFKIYYGSQGTGKTTQALKESNNVVMVCHSAMLPSDLLEDFKFEEGKPAFKKSALWEAMENGTKITLDEINLLPFESLRFLQSILDNKTEINYKGQVIHIKDGFQIIGTMNLTVNGSVFNLPEPLVDRAAELKEYKLTAEQLVGALI